MRGKQWLAGVLAILVATSLAYAPSLGNDFTMDDRYVAKSVYDDGRPNPMIAELRPLWEYFGRHYWYGQREKSPLYRPITILSYALCRATASETAGEAAEAWRQHLANLLLHVLGTWLALRLLQEILGRGPPALLGGLLFGLHPLHSEAVAGIAGRAELLAFCCGAGAAVLLASRRRGWRLLAASLLLFLAYNAKESAVAWLLFLPVLALARGWQGMETPPRARRAAIASIIVALVPAGAFLLLRHHAVSPDAGPALYLVNPLAHVATGTRTLTATAILGHGLYKTLLPFHLASDYGVAVFPILETPLSWRFLTAASVLLALVLGGIATARRHPPLLLAATLFFGFTFPVSNLPFAIGTIFGERLYYTPSLGLSFAAAWLLARIRSPRRRTAALALAAAWLVAATVVIVDRCRVWRDNATLFAHDAVTQPRSARLLANAASVAPDPERARSLYERAVALYPHYTTALRALGAYHLKQRGDYARSEDYFRRALASPHLDVEREAFDLHFQLLPLLWMEGRSTEGMQEVEAALRVARPDEQGQLFGFGGFLVRTGRRTEARQFYLHLYRQPLLRQDLRDRAEQAVRELR